MKTSGIKNWLKNNWKEITFFGIFSTLNIFFLNYASVAYSISFGSKKYIAIFIITLILEVLATVIIFKTKTKKWPIEKIFLALFIPVGLIYMLAIPIGRVPDESAHLTRSYGISIGHLITTANEDGKYGEYLPSDLAALSKENISYQSTIDQITDSSTEDSYVFVENSNIAIYNFLDFIPQSLGMLLGQILHLPTVFIAYLGRLFNFICFVTLFYFAIKKIPFGKTFLFFIAFLPVVLQEAVSLSADCLAISVSAAFISFILYLAYDRTSQLTRRNYIILLVFLLFESLCKIVYLPLCFLIFLIPKNKFKSKKDYLLKTVLPIIAIVVINLIWLKVASQYLIEYNPGVNSSEQIKHIITAPLAFLQTIFNTCISSMYQFAYGMFGGWLEWLDVEIGHIYLVLSIIISSVLIYKTSEHKIVISPIGRVLIIGVAVITMGLIFTSLYIQWNPVGSGFIGGIQGRYFLPVFLLAPAIACGLRKTSSTKPKKNPDDHSLLYLFSIFQSFAAIIVIICFHLGAI